jgi:hypothetical protein
MKNYAELAALLNSENLYYEEHHHGLGREAESFFI